MSKTRTLRLLIVEDSEDDAEALVSALRNAGYPVRPTHAMNREDLAAVLNDQDFELAVCSMDISNLGVRDVCALLESVSKEIPVIALAQEVDETAVIEAMRAGARDLVSKKHFEHLQLVIEREAEGLHQRRTLAGVEAGLRESEKRCRALLDTSRDAITYVHEGMHMYANNVYLELFGFAELEDIEGMPIMDMIAPDHHDKFKQFLRNQASEEETKGQLQLNALRPDGTTFDASMEFSPATLEGEACTQIIIRRSADQHALEQRLNQLTRQDIVTGLFNRSYFMERLANAVADIPNQSPAQAVLYILLDDFKSIKETVGIAATDLVLGDIAKVLQKTSAEQDFVAHFGENSFVILTEGRDLDSVQALAESICKKLADHISDVSGQAVTTTCSVGIALGHAQLEDAQAWLTMADQACEKARTEGGNRVHLLHPSELKVECAADGKRVAAVEDALEKGSFVLAYQPIVSLHGNTNEMYEVLVRMKGEQNREILPTEFIHCAEQAGLMPRLDRWIIQHALQVLAERHGRGGNTIMFIKIAPSTLADEELLPWITVAIQTARVPGDKIVFEIGEQAALAYLRNVRVLVKGLKAMHCGIALEHFGKTNNPFNLLKHLPVDYIKADESFMQGLAQSQDKQEALRDLIDNAHQLSKPIIAVHVEDAASLAVLWQMSVNFIQGYFLQEPALTLAYDFASEIA